MDEGGSAYIERIQELGEDGEREILNKILTEGFDQGCFLRPEEEHLLRISAMDAEAVLDAIRERGIRPNLTADDPFEQERPPTTDIEGTEPGYVVLSQQCDMLRALQDEPFVELARASVVPDSGTIREAKRNSPRLLYLADAAGGGAWVADLRLRALLAKDKLTEYPRCQVLADERSFKRFKLRVGQRYSRDALPGDLVGKLQRPLIKHLRKSSQAEKVELFTEFLAFRTGQGQVRIIAVAAEGVGRHEAEDAWAELEESLPEELIGVISEESGALPIDELSFWQYFRGWKLDLDEVTYAATTGDQQAEPSV